MIAPSVASLDTGKERIRVSVESIHLENSCIDKLRAQDTNFNESLSLSLAVVGTDNMNVNK